MALNIGIALRCNLTRPTPEFNCIETERHRRCWAGLLMLYTYQAILFQDVDLAFLANFKATMPLDVNDVDIHEDKILQPSSQPTQMSTTKFKIRIFQLSSRICQHLTDISKLDEACLKLLDEEISQEQALWDSTFLINGSPSLLNTSSYGHWCTLQQYAHQLYLLLHRPFSRANAADGRHYRAASRLKCITSGAALLDIHRQLVELPRLRHYRWYTYGMTGLCALHGAVALASCLLQNVDEELDTSSYRAIFDAAVLRINMLQSRSAISAKAYPVLQHLQYVSLSLPFASAKS